jgi:hypothetical protein
VAQSVTDISLMVPDLLSATNSLMVYASPDQTGAPLACGEIGGVLGADGSLTIGLQAMNGGNVSGVASFAPTRKGDGTTVSVNLVDEPSGHGGSDGGGDGAADGGGGGGGRGGNGGGGKSGGNGTSDGSGASDGAGASDGSGASDGAGASGGTDAAPIDPSQEDAINAIAALNPNIAPPPGASHQPGGNGMVDFPGRENRADRRGNGGKGEAASAGADGNASN